MRLFFRQEHPRDGGGLRGISHFQNKKVFAYLISMIILHVCNTERTQRFWFNCNPKIVFKPYNNFIFKFDNLKKNTRVSDKNQEFHYYFFWGGNYLWQNYNVLKTIYPKKKDSTQQQVIFKWNLLSHWKIPCMIGGQKQVAALLKLYFPYLQCWQQGMGCKITSPFYLTDRLSFRQFINLFNVLLYLCPSICLFIYMSVRKTLCCRYVFPSVCLSIFQSVSLKDLAYCLCWNDFSCIPWQVRTH